MYLNLCIVYFKGALAANDSHTVKAGAGVSESQDVSLKLPGEFIGLKHLCFGLEVLEKYALFAIDTLLGLNSVGLDNVRHILYQYLLSDGIFLKRNEKKDDFTLRCFSAVS